MGKIANCHSIRVSALAVIILSASLLAGGCGSSEHFIASDRMESGLVIILPGIEGESALNHDIRDGLVAAGIDYALPIEGWGLIPLLKQVNFIGNRLAGVRIANKIVEYQDKHPDNPVYVVGHSGGGGVAVFVAESMPKDKQIDGLILLSPSISSAHDLTKAMKHCKFGIVNFYNTEDAGLLGIGTILMGNVCGTHGPAAGLIGFDEPAENASDEKKFAYAKLFQVEVTQDMSSRGAGSHTGCTRPDFVAIYVAPWILSNQWPAVDLLARLNRSN